MQIDPYILAFSAITVIVTVWMGFRSAKTSKTASDFFVAGRSVSVGWNASAISGEYLSAASFMGVAGMVMSSGYDALWYPVCYACGYLFLLLFIAGPLRRFGAYTIPDFAEGRFDSPVFRKIAVVFVLFIGFFYTMPQMKGAGTTLAYIFPGLPYWVGVALVGAVITLNVALGGMKGITLVQAVQYWIKMFAISVPIFVLMAVYGHYGKQLEINGRPVGKSLKLIPLREALEANQLKPLGEIDRAIPELLRRYSRTAPNVVLVESSLTNTWKEPALAIQISDETSANVLESLLTERGIRLLHCANETVAVPNARFEELKQTYEKVGLYGLTKADVPNRFRFLSDSYRQVVYYPQGQQNDLSKMWHSTAAWVTNQIKPAPIRLSPSVMQIRQLGVYTFVFSQATQRPVWTDPALHTLKYADDKKYHRLNITLTNLTSRGIVQQLTAEFQKRGIALIAIREGTLLVPTERVAYYRSAYEREGMYPFSDQEASGRVALPDKAPKDETWLNPFGPLTTKAAKAAKAAPRWNLSKENRAALRDIAGQEPTSNLEAVLDKAEDVMDGAAFRKPSPGASQFADWTNTPPNSSRQLPGGFPVLATLHEFGLLAARPVLVATNLPRGRMDVGGAFHSRDELLKQWEARLLTNGVRLDLAGAAIKAVATADWDHYVKNPASVPLVPNRLFGVQTNAESRLLADQYSKAVGKDVLMATNLPPPAFAGPPAIPQSLLAHEAAALIQKTLAERGVTLIPASAKEVWAVPTAELAKFQLKPVDEKQLALLYTYSLIIALVCGTAGLPHILVRFYTNPDGVAAKRTTMWVMILIGVFYVFPPVFGVMGRNLLPELYSGVGSKGTDKVVLELPRILNQMTEGDVPRRGEGSEGKTTLSPSSPPSQPSPPSRDTSSGIPWGSILSGITCAGAFAAFMSTFSGLLVSMTGALAHDVYGRMLRPKSTPEQRMRMFKFAAVLLGGIAIVLGCFVEPLEINFMVGQAFAIAAASYFPLLFMSVWWRGMTMRGAATGMLTGGLCALIAATLTNVSNLALDKGPMGKIFASFAPLNDFWAAHPLLRILCEQPAIWTVPLAITLMIVVSKLTAKEVPADIRMKMLVLHAPEKLGLKQEYIQEHQHGH